MKSNESLLKSTQKKWKKEKVAGPIGAIRNVVSAIFIAIIPISNYLINHIWYITNEEGLKEHVFKNFLIGTLIFFAIYSILSYLALLLSNGEGIIWGIGIGLVLTIGMLFWLYKTTERHVIIYGIYLGFALYVGVYVSAIMSGLVELLFGVVKKGTTDAE